MTNLIERLRDHDHDFHVSPDLLLEAADEIERLKKRADWLESLFDFSDPEVVCHTAPGDPVTKDAIVVLRSHYEQKSRPRANPSGAATVI